MAAVEIEPAEEGFQTRCGMILGYIRILGHGVNSCVASAAVNIPFRVGEHRENFAYGLGLSGSGNIFNSFPMKASGGAAAGNILTHYSCLHEYA